MKSKFVLAFALVFAVLMPGALAQLSDVDISYMAVYANDALVWEGQCVYNESLGLWDCSAINATVAIERGENMALRVVFIAVKDISKAYVKAWIIGYHEDIEDRTATFDIFANKSYTKKLELGIPADIDALDSYTLHVAIEAKNALKGVDEAVVDLTVQRATHLLDILSVECYSSSGKIESGTNLYVDVVVKNRGSHDAEDVYVDATLKGTGIARTVYLGDLSSDDDDEDAKKVTLMLPLTDVKAGSYVLEVTAYNVKTSSTVRKDIVVSGEQQVAGNVKITPQLTVQNIEQGESAVYAIEIVNLGTRQSFSISTEGTEGWATVQLSPSSFSLGAGESTVVNIYVTVDEDAVAAEHLFTVRVNYGAESESYMLKANVIRADRVALDLKTVLMIVSLVLGVAIVVLLIVLLTRQGTIKAEETYY